jgi:hypothetical protein
MTQSRISTHLTHIVSHLPSYETTGNDETLLKTGIESFIVHKLLRKKFRKQKLHPDTISEFSQKITASVKNNKPIHFSIPFGGYKHFWNSSHPSTDWAEVFTLRFLLDWVTPISTLYKPGVILEFISEDIILPRMNNYPLQSLEVYAKSFQTLITRMNTLLPKNISFQYFRIGDRFNRDSIVRDVEQLLPERWKLWETYSQSKKEEELHRSKRAVFWNGDIDLSTLTSQEKDRKIIESRLIELAYYDVEARPQYLGDYFTNDNRIGVCFTFGKSADNATHWITLGSTYASAVDFWIGRGILEVSETEITERIVSNKQYSKLLPFITKEQVHVEGLTEKNYSYIDVITPAIWKQAILDVQG